MTECSEHVYGGIDNDWVQWGVSVVGDFGLGCSEYSKQVLFRVNMKFASSSSMHSKYGIVRKSIL